MNQSDIVTHGEELLRTGSLSWKRSKFQNKDRLKCNFYMLWPSHSDIFPGNSGEEVVFTASKKNDFKSVLHFAWTILSFHREIDHKEELRQLVQASTIFEITQMEGVGIIHEWSAHWLKNYGQLIPEAEKRHVVIDLDFDKFVVFETLGEYFGWAWSSSA